MSFDPRELRNALGRFATGVCLITVTTEQGESLAMTANSFSSVSLEPPLVLWSLQDSSDVYDEFATPKYFGISILSADQMELSNQYAKKGQHGLDPAHFTLGENGAPLINDALVNFECAMHETHDAGDHLIIIGRVTHMECPSDADPLLFFSGGYRGIA